MQKIFLILSLSLLFLTLYFQKSQPQLVNYSWFLSILLLVLYTLWPIKIKKPHFTTPHILLAVILLFSLLLRLYNLTSLPWFVHGDEAEIGLNAQKIIAGNYPNLVNVAWYDVPLLSFTFPIPFFLLFGENLFSLRLTSVILGLISIFITYLLSHLFFNRQISLTASLLLATSSLHLHFSRSGTHYLQAVVFFLLSSYFFFNSLQKKNPRLLILSGLFIGFSFQVYYSARTIIIILSILIFYKIFDKDFRSQIIFILKFLLIGFSFSFLPLALYFFGHQQAFISRAQQVIIFNQPEHIKSVYHTNFWPKILFNQTIKTLHFFFGGPDGSTQFATKFGGFDYLTSIFFFLGLILVLKNLKTNIFYPFLLISVFLILSAVIITNDIPFSPRLLIITPLVSIICALVLSYTSKLLFAIIIFLITLFNLNMYFIDYAFYQPQTSHTLLAYFVKNWQQSHRDNYYCFYSNGSIYLDYPTTKFLAPDAQGETILTSNIPTRCTLLICHSSRFDLSQKLKKPTYKVSAIKNNHNQEVFRVLMPR